MTAPTLRMTHATALDAGLESVGPTRVGLWYPQGDGGLPLAARLMVRGLADVAFAWVGSGATPVEPRGATIDLWLVVCAGAPPAPPAWRFSQTGRWVIYPGAASAWTAETRAAVEGWCPALVLSDLLPDEARATLWFDWKSAQAFGWMPAWADGPAGAGGESVVVRGADWLGGASEALAPALAEALGGRLMSEESLATQGENGAFQVASLTGPVVLCSVDPVVAGIVLRNATRRATRVASLTAGHEARLRSALLGGTPDWASSPGAIESGGARLGPTLRPMLRAVSVGQERSPAPVPDWAWSKWIEALARPDLSHGELLDAVALIMRHAPGSFSANRAPSTPLRQWLGDALTDLWRVRPPETRMCEASAVTWVLRRFDLAKAMDAADLHALARVYALRGDADGAEWALRRFAETCGGEARELPGSIALALSRRGHVERGRSLLRAWADVPALSPMACFVLAVAGEVLGVTEVVSRNLDCLLAAAPGFLQEDAADGRWAMAALVARVAGDEAAASRWLGRAESHRAGNAHLIQVCAETGRRHEAVDARWSVLFGSRTGR